jgi:hypothetical protein
LPHRNNPTILRHLALDGNELEHQVPENGG